MSTIYSLQSTDLIKDTFDDINDNFTALNTDKADTSSLGSAAFMSGPGGSILGTNDAQTITNKGISLGSNTVTGTLAQFNTACTDADFATGGGTATGTNSGDITLAGTPNYITIVGQVITRSLIDLTSHVTGLLPFANIANVATSTVMYRKTAGTGAMEAQTLATLKTDLGLTGTNSGDQTSIVGITGTMAQFDTAVSDGNIVYQGQALGTPASGNMDNCTADGTDKVGFRNIPQNSQSAAYTTVLADGGKHLYHPSADVTARTFTIAANSSVAYPIGTALTFVNDTSAGAVTIAINTDTLVLAGAGTTGSRTLAANGVATAIKVTSTRWIISGVNLT